MAKENEYALVLTETEMRTALETINQSSYIGKVSDTVSSLREKLDVDKQQPIKPRRRKGKAEEPKE